MDGGADSISPGAKGTPPVGLHCGGPLSQFLRGEPMGSPDGMGHNSLQTFPVCEQRKRGRQGCASSVDGPGCGRAMGMCLCWGETEVGAGLSPKGCLRREGHS